MGSSFGFRPFAAAFVAGCLSRDTVVPVARSERWAHPWGSSPCWCLCRRRGFRCLSPSGDHRPRRTRLRRVLAPELGGRRRRFGSTSSKHSFASKGERAPQVRGARGSGGGTMVRRGRQVKRTSTTRKTRRAAAKVATARECRGSGGGTMVGREMQVKSTAPRGEQPHRPRRRCQDEQGGGPCRGTVVPEKDEPRCERPRGQRRPCRSKGGRSG